MDTSIICITLIFLAIAIVPFVIMSICKKHKGQSEDQEA